MGTYHRYCTGPRPSRLATARSRRVGRGLPFFGLVVGERWAHLSTIAVLQGLWVFPIRNNPGKQAGNRSHAIPTPSLGCWDLLPVGWDLLGQILWACGGRGVSV